MMGSVRGGNPVLKPETVDAWDRYIEAASAKAKQRETPGVRFLSIDESSERQLRQGEVLVAPNPLQSAIGPDSRLGGNSLHPERHARRCPAREPRLHALQRHLQTRGD